MAIQTALLTFCGVACLLPHGVEQQSPSTGIVKPQLAITHGTERQRHEINLAKHGRCFLEVQEIPNHEGTDRFSLDDPCDIVILSGKGKVLARHEFNSSYAMWSLDVIDLDADGHPEIVLVTGSGRGTGVRFEHLTVLTVAHGRFHERFSTPYSGNYGSVGHWDYERQYEKLPDKGVQLVLTLKYSPIEESLLADPTAIPADKRRIIQLAAVKGLSPSETVKPQLAISSLNEQQRHEITLAKHGRCFVEVHKIPEKPDSGRYDDLQEAILFSEKNQVVTRHKFSSSYGDWMLDVVDLDADNDPEIVLVTGEGRGTSARRERMTVLTVANGRFHERLSTPYSGFTAGGAHHWHYERKYEKLADAAVQIVLTLMHESDDATLVPPDKQRIIRVAAEVQKN